ncbi:Protein amnionless [Nymphon striatum]|nr:Protein amnionless [Nymphon striatum]
MLFSRPSCRGKALDLMKVKLLVTVRLCYLSTCEAATKTWSSNTNFGNSENWDVLRKPCKGDNVIFPKNLRGAVFIEKATIGKEMVLPNDGQLILSKNLDLKFSNTVDDSCDAQDVHFIKTEWKNWFDTENWNTTDFQPGETPIPNPVPHSDRIPCTDDDVEFPPKNSFRVAFSSNYASVRSLSIYGQKYSTNEFKSFISSDVGSAQFQINGNVQITGDVCQDQTGCSCQNSRTEILEAICSAVGLKCENPRCEQPIKPIGHCCRMCGSYIVMTYSRGFKFSRIQELAKSFLNKGKYINCRGYISKTNDNKIQFIITDSGDDIGKRLAKDFTTHLNTDIKGDGIYNLKSVERFSSGKELPEDEISSIKKRSALVGKIVGIFFGILIFIVIVVIAFYVYRKNRYSDFSFVRFSPDKIEMELGTTPHSALDPGTMSPLQHAFNNPMYDLPVDTEGTVEPADRVKLSKKSKVEFENPVYMEYEEDKDN